MTNKELNNSINAKISKLFLEHSYKKRKEKYYKQIDKYNYGIVQFSTALFRTENHVYVTPHIGLLNVQVENIMKRLVPYDNIKHMSPTIHIPLGYIMPDNQYKEWDFVNGVSIDVNIGDMFNSVEKYAPPYWNKMKDTTTLLNTYKNATGIHSFDRGKYLPVLYLLVGNKQEGLKVIEDTIKKMQTPIPSKGNIEVINNPEIKGSYSSGYKGQVDPSYLEFAEKYKHLE